MQKRYDRSYIVFIVFYYIFVFKNLLESYIPMTKYIDEVLVSLTVPILIINLKRNNYILRISKYAISIIVFVIVGILGNFLFQYQPFFKAALPDLFLCIKFWLAIYVGQYLFGNLDLSRLAKKIYSHIKFVSWLYVALIIIDNIFNVFPANERFGLRSTMLFYQHPTIFAAQCMFLIGILFMVRPYVMYSELYFILLLVLMCTTLRSKSFGVALLLGFIYYLVAIRKKKVRLRTFIMIIPTILAIGWNQIQYYFFSSIQSDSARYQLSTKSLQLATDHFPIGTGFGTFGSYISGEIYSPLYFLYGLTNVHGLSEGEAFFVSDSFWPMIIGQTGYIGFLAWAIALWYLYCEMQKHKKQNASWYMASIFILAYLVVISMAEAAFVHSIAIPLGIILGFLLKKMQNIGEVL